MADSRANPGSDRLIVTIRSAYWVALTIVGAMALWQPEGGIARHDAVAWGYARMASRLGVDIVENCEVERIDVSHGRVIGVQTSRWAIAAGTVLVTAAAETPSLVSPLGVDLPIEPVTLQAFVSEPLKPVLDVVVLAGAVEGSSRHFRACG